MEIQEDQAYSSFQRAAPKRVTTGHFVAKVKNGILECQENHAPAIADISGFDITLLKGKSRIWHMPAAPGLKPICFCVSTRA